MEENTLPTAEHVALHAAMEKSLKLLRYIIAFQMRERERERESYTVLLH